MAARVKLCAIARNEGAYLADWVFHHLHFGFDAVEVMVNATEDPSLELLERIGSAYPQVSGRSADELREESIAKGWIFQHRAYARAARRARRQGFTHAAFLDLDEYWTPRDLRSAVTGFLPEDPVVNVVSFPWGMDVPDPARAPFTLPLTPPVRFQRDSHVKSVSRLDDTVERYGMHTARTSSGTALLVRDPFPGGDRVSDDELVASWGELPEAFVLHATNRSQREYVASLAKGRRQIGGTAEYNVDRFGYLPTEAPVLTLVPEESALRAYDEARRAFLTEVDVDDLTERSQGLVADRADGVVARLVEDRSLLELLRGPLRGVREPALDAAYPGWDDRVVWWVDSVSEASVTGWAYLAGGPGEHRELEFGLRDADHREWTDLAVTRVARPEVVAERPGAPLDCGFEVRVPDALEGDLAGAQLLARPVGSATWEATRLSRVLSAP